jgi:hypothetical protein
VNAGDGVKRIYEREIIFRNGSFATNPAGPACRLMSRFDLKATDALLCSEMTRWANNGLRYRCNGIINHLVSTQQEGLGNG